MWISPLAMEGGREEEKGNEGRATAGNIGCPDRERREESRSKLVIYLAKTKFLLSASKFALIQVRAGLWNPSFLVLFRDLISNGRSLRKACLVGRVHKFVLASFQTTTANEVFVVCGGGLLRTRTGDGEFLDRYLHDRALPR